MNIVRLITCNNAVEAHLIKGKLNNEGIECFITNENIATLKPHYNDLLGFGIEIMIKEDDLPRALELIKDKLEPEQKPIVCTYCGSDWLETRINKNKVQQYFTIIVSMLFARPLRNVNTKYYCKRCRKEIR